jgi:hypothetical protein
MTLALFRSLLCLWLSIVSLASVSASESELSQSPGWLRLLHMKRSFPLGKLRSEVDSPQFFFDPEGIKDPEKEFKASLQAFQKQPELQCTFPARFQFLNQKLKLNLSKLPCPELDRFLNRMSGDGVSLIFSSAYPNSPPSMFGHTFLRIHRQDREVLLDESINYAAQASPEENAIAFAVFGLMGGYYGEFGISPYYMKVNEYAHAESRDLWEYDLSLNRSEIETFLKHVWELNQKGFFKYFFFDENCSYRILTLLEVARPDWDLSGFSIHVIPAETVKRVLKVPGAVQAIHYRPSLSSQMKTKWSQLSAPEENQAREIIRSPSRALDSTVSLEVLDATLSYFQYKKLKNKNTLDATDQNKFLLLLSERAKRGVFNEPQLTSVGHKNKKSIPQGSQSDLSTANLSTPGLSNTEPVLNRPDQGHPPYKWSLGFGAFNLGNQGLKNQSSTFQELQFKFAYHDLLNDDRGYIPFSHIDFPTLTLRASDRFDRLWIERLSLFSVTALSPWDQFEKPLSWKVDVAYVSPKDLICLNCHAVMVEGGVGVAAKLLSNRLIAYGLGLLRFESGSAIENSVRFLPQVQAGLISQVVDHYKVQATISHIQDVFQNARRRSFYTAEFNQSLSIRPEWELRLMSRAVRTQVSQKNASYTEAVLSMSHYY